MLGTWQALGKGERSNGYDSDAEGGKLCVGARSMIKCFVTFYLII